MYFASLQDLAGRPTLYQALPPSRYQQYRLGLPSRWSLRYEDRYSDFHRGMEASQAVGPAGGLSFGLITGGWPGVDYVVAQAFWERLIELRIDPRQSPTPRHARREPTGLPRGRLHS